MLMSAAQRINSWLQTHLGVFHQRAQIVHDITILDRQSLWVIPISALPTCTKSYGRLTSHVFFKRMIVLLLSAARMANSVEKFCRSRQRYIFDSHELDKCNCRDFSLPNAHVGQLDEVLQQGCAAFQIGLF